MCCKDSTMSLFTKIKYVYVTAQQSTRCQNEQKDKLIVRNYKSSDHISNCFKGNTSLKLHSTSVTVNINTI